MQKKEPITEEVLCGEYKSVFRYVMTLCRNETDASDITQEAFLRAIRNKDKFSNNSSLYTWLCTIAKNVWLNKCKAAKKEVALELYDENQESSDTPLEQLVAEKDTAFYVHKALHSLSEPYKEAFSLRIFGELSFKEIAGLFGKTESWARVTFYRAKNMLIEKLRKDGIM